MCFIPGAEAANQTAVEKGETIQNETGLAENFPPFWFFFLLRKRKLVLDQDAPRGLKVLKIFLTSKRVLRAGPAHGP